MTDKEKLMENECDYLQTQFNIAELSGESEVIKTFKELFDTKRGADYIINLCHVTWRNWWYFNFQYGEGNSLESIYGNFYNAIVDWCCENLKGKDYARFQAEILD